MTIDMLCFPLNGCIALVDDQEKLAIVLASKRLVALLGSLMQSAREGVAVFPELSKSYGRYKLVLLESIPASSSSVLYKVVQKHWVDHYSGLGYTVLGSSKVAKFRKRVRVEGSKAVLEVLTTQRRVVWKRSFGSMAEADVWYKKSLYEIFKAT